MTSLLNPLSFSMLRLVQVLEGKFRTCALLRALADFTSLNALMVARLKMPMAECIDELKKVSHTTFQCRCRDIPRSIIGLGGSLVPRYSATEMRNAIRKIRNVADQNMRGEDEDHRCKWFVISWKCFHFPSICLT